MDNATTSRARVLNHLSCSSRLSGLTIPNGYQQVRLVNNIFSRFKKRTLRCSFPSKLNHTRTRYKAPVISEPFILEKSLVSFCWNNGDNSDIKANGYLRT